MCALEQTMGEKENQIDSAIREAFGWQITNDQFRDNLKLARKACDIAADFARIANIYQDRIFKDKLKNAEKEIKLLEEQGLPRSRCRSGS